MTELQHKAADAWRHVSRAETVFTRVFDESPLPVGPAIDMVQDVTGDRDDAVTALVGAAAAWLRDRTPPAPPVSLPPADEFDHSNRQNASLVCDYLAAESGMAEVFLRHVGEMCQSPLMLVRDDLMLLADAWTNWVRDARRAIDLCREISAAAYPTEGETS